MMKRLFEEFLFLRKGEQRALIFVLLILILSLAIRIIADQKMLPVVEPDQEFFEKMAEIQREIEIFREEKKNSYHSKDEKFRLASSDKQYRYGAENAIREVTPFPFDPNRISYDSLMNMQLSEYVCRNIVSYREAGGIFYRPEDMEKIYGLEQDVFETLLPFIQISAEFLPGFNKDTIIYRDRKNLGQAELDSIRKDYIPAWKNELSVEINSADSASLLSIPGIGPWYAGRIIRYRDLLGGFIQPEQLMEVYGMDSARLEQILPYIRIDSTLIHHLDLNSVTFRDLLSHPYLNRQETYAIMQYRDFRDSIKEVENILNNQIIERERFRRVRPYLTVHDGQE